MKTEIRRLTLKFSAVGWLLATLLVGLMGAPFGERPFLDWLLVFAEAFLRTALLMAVPLFLSSLLASQWMGWVLARPGSVDSRYFKYCAFALIAILIAVGGAGFLIVLGHGAYLCVQSLQRGNSFLSLFELFPDAALALALGAGLPLLYGAWAEIPMVFLYAYQVRKTVQKHVTPAKGG